MKFNELGRSMVEMLGVLAIIGVLSVGAISGYSKAMLKYKLNKQAEQLDTLFRIVSQYLHEWKFTKSTNLIPYYIKMGEIPTEMIRGNDTNNIYDVFSSKIDIRNNNAPAFDEVVIMYHIDSNNTFDVCQNIFQAAIQYSPQIYYTSVVSVENGSDSNLNKIYGDTACNDQRQCLKNLSLEGIYQQCQTCSTKENCSLAFVLEVF